MPRVKLIFDQEFGISNCWYPLDSFRHVTVNNITQDLRNRFGVKGVTLEKDGFKFLGDGLTRLLFKDNDQITVRSVSRKRSNESLEDIALKKIKLAPEVHDEISNSMYTVDLIDSADEYCSESSMECGEELDTLVDSTLTKLVKDNTSFHLAVNTGSVIQDPDSSEVSCVSSNEVEIEKNDQVKEDFRRSIDSLGKAQDLDKKEVNIIKSDQALNSKHGEKDKLIKDRLVYYDSGKAEDLTIVLKKPHDDKISKYKYFYQLAQFLKDKKGYWVSGNAILSKLKSRFFSKYGYSSWKEYLQVGQEMDILDFRAIKSGLEIRMSEASCYEILRSADYHSKEMNTDHVFGTRKPVIKAIQKNIEPVAVSKSDEGDIDGASPQLIPALPTFSVNNNIIDIMVHERKSLIPAFPTLPLINDYRPITNQNVVLLPPAVKPALPVPPVINHYRPPTNQNVVFVPPPVKPSFLVTDSFGSKNDQNVVFVPQLFKPTLPLHSDGSINYQDKTPLIQPSQDHNKATIMVDSKDKKSGTWGVDDTFFGETELPSQSLKNDSISGAQSNINGNSTQLLDKGNNPAQDISKSKNLTDQYKCFVDLAKYCENFDPEEWIPGNGFISQHQNFYLKYGQSRWKTYLEWGKKLKLLDFRLISSDLHVRMSQSMRQMIISLDDSPSERSVT